MSTFVVIDGSIMTISESGRQKTVGTLSQDGIATWYPGCQSCSRRFEQWRKGEKQDSSFVDVQKTVVQEPEPVDILLPEVHDIPTPDDYVNRDAEALPPFTKQHGTNTPGFMEWVREHKLKKNEIADLVRRLEKN